MDTIHKYHLGVVDNQLLYMPEGAVTLAVQVQNGQPCLWARVDDEKKTEVRLIITVGTSHKVPDNVTCYIGSYQLHDGQLVFHVFEGTYMH